MVLRKARRFVPRGAHSVNVGPYLNSQCECWMLPSQTIRGGVEMARTPLAQRIEDAYAEVVEARTTRRELVKRTAAAGVALAGASTMGHLTKAAYGGAAPGRVARGGARPPGPSRAPPPPPARPQPGIFA